MKTKVKQKDVTHIVWTIFLTRAIYGGIPYFHISTEGSKIYPIG
jgi:hypothetical protein